MNKYQEALNSLCGCDVAYYQGDKEVETLQELVDKEKPVKPIDNHYEEEGQKPYIKYICPRCEQLNNKRYSLCSLYRYCPTCGQRLDWSVK